MGKAYTQEEKNEIYEAYKEGFTVQNICKYVASAKGRSEEGIRCLIRAMQAEEEQGDDELVKELKRMNDLKIKELDILESCWVSLRNIAVNTKNLSDEFASEVEDGK